MAAIFIIIGFAVSTVAGILLIISVIVFGLLFFLFTRARYKSIARISNQIDLVLHHNDHLFIAESKEGELSILQSEVTKMTLRIREQNEALQKEKEHLADLLADIAHQLRTPLTSTNIILSLLANSPDANQQKAFVREAEELLMRMDWLLTSLLKISQLDAGIVTFQKEQVKLNELFHTALRPFLIPMELHHITLQLEVSKDLMLQGDFSWLSEALQNILKNCIESVGDEGKIRLIGRENPMYTEIIIHDNGKGFKKEELPSLFERFYQGKSTNATGFGIGLALCKEIITQQGGTITAKNHPEGGAIFEIHFLK